MALPRRSPLSSPALLSLLPLLLPLLLLLPLAAAQDAVDGNKNKALNSNADHRAHAVAGGPYLAYARRPQKALVSLDASRSHSHYFDPATGATGRIVKFQWSAAGSVVCRKVRCSVRFAHGNVLLKLRVEDNTKSVAEAETTVAVKDLEIAGMRVWFYAAANTKTLFDPGSVVSSATVAKVGDAAVAKSLYGKPVQAAYFGMLKVEKSGTYRFAVACKDGAGYCYGSVGGDTVFQGNAGGSSKAVQLAAALYPLYVSCMQNKAAADGFVKFSWAAGKAAKFVEVPKEALVHVPTGLAPVVNSVGPASVSPGAVLTVKGTGFSVGELVVTVGGELCTSLSAKSDTTATCVVPAAATGNKVAVVVATSQGKSNSKFVTVSSGAASGVGYYQEANFYETHFKTDTKSNTPYKVNQVASIAYGPDGRYYLGSLNGRVHALTVDSDYVVTDHCVSEHLGDKYSILGLGFNPAEFPTVRLYAAVSLLYWEEKHNMSRASAWRNGRVITMEPNKNDNCLGVVNNGLVTGLPISNHDHGLNQIRFDDNGNLLLSVGGSTNGGKAVAGSSGTIGAVPDSPFSGAIVQIPVLKPRFNGAIKYTKPASPGTTDVAGAVDVNSYADGLRNVYSHVLHSNGKHYAVDNGANEGFGEFSSGCKAGDVRPSKHDGDALRLLEEGGFHGYANLNRGRKDPKQCVHRDLSSPAEDGYVQQIDYFESATTGLLEWTTNTFGGSLRGNMFASKFAINDNGKTFRVVLGGDGTSVESKYEIAAYSGVASQLTPFGGIAMPRVWQQQVAVLAAKEENPGIVTVSSVFPVRGPKKGGQRVLVTGWNLVPPLTATIGGKPCTKVGNFAPDGRSFKCNAPPGSGKVPVIVVSGESVSQSWGWEYWYMNV